MITRRGLIGCLTGIIAAPMIVKAESLMKIVPIEEEEVGYWFGVDGGVFTRTPGVLSLTKIRELLLPGLWQIQGSADPYLNFLDPS